MSTQQTVYIDGQSILPEIPSSYNFQPSYIDGQAGFLPFDQPSGEVTKYIRTILAENTITHNTFYVKIITTY